MKNILMVAMLSAVACTLACQPSTNGQAPQPLEQTVIAEYGAEKEQVDSAREKLTILQNKLKNSIQQWRDTPAPAGPTFSGEDDVLATEILADCDTLKIGATDLSSQTYIRNYEGVEADLQDMIRFAENTVEEIQKRTQVQ